MGLANSPTTNEQSDTSNTIEEFGIIIAAQDLTPTMMSEDFLKFSGIIPKEWELAQQPVLNPSMAQLNYTNGVSISAQPRNITLSESLANKELEDIAIASVATKYIEKLPLAEYLGISISPKILVPFPQNPAAVRKYISESLLGSGSWKTIGKAPVQANINLMYILENCQLTINIAEARMQKPQQSPMAALLFSGSFNYSIDPNISAEDKMKQLKNALSFWRDDLQTFRNTILNKFLAASNTDDSIPNGSVFGTL